MDMLMALLAVAFVIGMLVFGFLKFLKPMIGGGGRAGLQNKYMQKVIDDYNGLAAALQAPPPEIPEHQGYKGWPILTVQKDGAKIVVTPTTDYWGEFERSLLYRDPYIDAPPSDRTRNAAIGQAAMSVLDAVTGVDMDPMNNRIRADQLTTVKLAMPARFRGSRILIRPETLAGKLTSVGEVKIEHPGFDAAFKVNGGNEAMVRQLLTPEMCDALMQFKARCGKFQLNEDHLLWANVTLDVSKVPNVVAAMQELFAVMNK